MSECVCVYVCVCVRAHLRLVDGKHSRFLLVFKRVRKVLLIRVVVGGVHLIEVEHVVQVVPPGRASASEVSE